MIQIVHKFFSKTLSNFAITYFTGIELMKIKIKSISSNGRLYFKNRISELVDTPRPTWFVLKSPSNHSRRIVAETLSNFQFHRLFFSRKFLSIPKWDFGFVNWLFPGMKVEVLTNSFILHENVALWHLAYHKIFIFHFVCFIEHLEFFLNLILNFLSECSCKSITAKFWLSFKLCGINGRRKD